MTEGVERIDLFAIPQRYRYNPWLDDGSGNLNVRSDVRPSTFESRFKGLNERNAIEGSGKICKACGFCNTTRFY